MVRSHCPDSESFQFSREAGKDERPAVFHRDRERQLRLRRFAPFVESLCRNEAAAFSESLVEGRRFIDRLSSRINCPVRDLGVLGPMGHPAPLQRIEGARPSLRIESDS